MTEGLVARADDGLHGSDAIQLRVSAVGQDAIGRDVVFATFDQALMSAAVATGIRV